ncbi:hypothetical protein JCM10908_001247 [Rhodotorula pacifica]|uniref:uncharacterized protein n=1 Tax=Rhodotorula pacifica TaxID=1495444 RepID=UPI0031713879
MTSIRTHAKPALHLSLAPQTESLPSTPGTSSRRIGSWGSVASAETYQRLAAYGDQSMTALPSPLPSPLEGQEWGFLPNQPRRNRSDTAGTGTSWLDGWGGSIGTNGTQRGAADGIRTPGANEFGAFPSASTSALPNPSATPEEGRKPATRSKTLSFFGTGQLSDESTGALSPPPNPPSRQNSLRQRPEPSATLPLPPSPGWDHVVDPMRSSVASSSGGSWMDRSSDEKGTWNRGRGGSIGSVASTEGSLSRWPSLRASTGRYASPDRHEHSFSSDADVSDLRPRLAALNTSALSPTTDTFSSSAGAAALPRPMSQLPSAIDVSSAMPRSRFVTLDTLDSASPATPSTRRGFVDLKDTPDRITGDGSNVARRRADESPRRSFEQDRPSCSEEPDEDDNAPQLQHGDRLGDFVIERALGKGAFSRVALARRSEAFERQRPKMGHARTASRDGGGDGGLVALKLVRRKACEGNERMRISVMREVEVLKTIQHPSLVSMFSSFSTPIYTALVLEYCDGGELFDFLASWHSHLTESLARRIFGELLSAVGWMHEICLIHRDIKLENILLTARPFPCASPAAVLSTLPTPFIKLTDFGLSRFVNPASPLLATRCGSEEYAAPELIMGKMYDGRQTDAWALGVVLYAIVTGVMPFVESVIGGSRARKAYLLKIAKADFRWPGQTSLSRASSLSAATLPSHPRGASDSVSSTPGSTMSSPHMSRLVTPSVQALVEGLLVRDPAKRATVAQVWEMEWMQGEGRPERRSGIVRRQQLEQSRHRLGSESWEL